VRRSVTKGNSLSENRIGIFPNPYMQHECNNPMRLLGSKEFWGFFIDIVNVYPNFFSSNPLGSSSGILMEF
jgi:hypothetical protein